MRERKKLGSRALADSAEGPGNQRVDDSGALRDSRTPEEAEEIADPEHQRVGRPGNQRVDNPDIVDAAKLAADEVALGHWAWLSGKWQRGHIACLLRTVTG